MAAEGCDTGLDNVEAMKWYRMVADEEDRNAHYQLGIIYTER